MGLGKKYAKSQSRILELEKALKQAIAIIEIQKRELKLHRPDQEPQPVTE